MQELKSSTVSQSVASFASHKFKNLTIEIARTEQDYLKGLQILHDGYVQRGVMEKMDHGLRLTKYHLGPMTTMIVAKVKGEVVGTISLICDGPLDLPLSAGWDISFLRQQGLLLAEVSSLTVKHEYRRYFRRLLYPMLKFLIIYVTQYTSLDSLVISTDTRSARFYTEFFGFRPLRGGVQAYDFVSGEASVAQCLNIKEWEQRRNDVLAIDDPDEIRHNNFRRFVDYMAVTGGSERLLFPERVIPVSADSALSPEFFQRLIHIKLSEEELTDIREYQILAEHYGCREIMSDYQQPLFRFPKRKANRLYVGSSVNVRSHAHSSLNIEARILDASQAGVGLLSSNCLALGDVVQVLLPGSQGRLIPLNGVVCNRFDDRGRYGVELVGRQPQAYQDFVQDLKAHYRLRMRRQGLTRSA